MTTSFYTKLLHLISWTFTHFTPIFFIFCMAIVCSCVSIIRYIVGLKRS